MSGWRKTRPIGIAARPIVVSSEVDPALRAPHRLPLQVDEHDRGDRTAEDPSPGAAIEVRVDERRDDQADRSGTRVHGLAVQVVVRVERDVVARDPLDRPEAGRHNAADGEEEDPVDLADDVGERKPFAPHAGLFRAAVLEDGHQSEWIGPVVAAFVWKYCSKTFSAAGAAAVPPWPPFSITAHTTSVGLSNGPKPHHHDWFFRSPV